MREFTTVERGDFARRLITATAATAFHRAPAFKLGFEATQTGAKAVLDDGAAKVRTFFDAAVCPEVCAGLVDAERAIDVMTALLDTLAATLWRSIAAGATLEPRDVVFLKRWTEHRAPCGSRVSADEASRLFGDAPEITANVHSVAIDWEGPERVIGADASYLQRKEAAQAAFGHAVDDAAERFAAACVAAFLAAFDRAREH